MSQQRSTQASSSCTLFLLPVCTCTLSVVRFLPQQLSLALQAVQQLNLAVHVSDLILEVLTSDVHLLAELSKHPPQLPDNHRQHRQKQCQSLASSLVGI